MLLLAGIAYARDFLMPVVLAFLLALIFSPIRRFLERRHIPVAVSAFLIVGVLVAALVGGLYSLSGPIRGWVDRAPEIGYQVEHKLQKVMGSAKAVLDAGKKVNELTTPGAGDNAQEVVVRKPGVVEGAAYLAPGIVGQALFTLILLLFLLLSGDMFYEKLVHVLPTFKDKRRAMTIVHDIERKLSHYLLTITTINLGLGVAIGLTMWVIGMPNPLLFGVIGFVFNYVPYVGAVSGIVIATIVGLINFDTLGASILPGLLFFAATTIEGQFITPYFVGRRLEMNAVVIFLAVALWAWLWSIMGMLIAVPLLVTIRVFCEHIPALAGLGDFLSARGCEKERDDTPAVKT
ncbi:hypothetical protein T31B1_06190 [Salinisphaera sp. T31B1]